MIETLPSGWETCEVSYPDRKRLEIIEIASQTRYAHEPLFETAFKCAAVALLLPLFTALYIAWHALRALMAPGCFSRQIRAIVRAPFFALRMEFAALYGIFRPLTGRKWIAIIERRWKEVPKDDDFRRLKDQKEELFSFFWRAMTEKEFPTTAYLAYCMQPKIRPEIRPDATLAPVDAEHPPLPTGESPDGIRK